MVGDLNDEPQAATTQILDGLPGSQIGTTGYQGPDHGDLTRLWNLEPLIPESERFSRVYQGQRELIDHILLSRALVTHVTEMHTILDRPLPSCRRRPQRPAADTIDHPGGTLLAHLNRVADTLASWGQDADLQLAAWPTRSTAPTDSTMP